MSTFYNKEEFDKSLPAGFDGVFDWEFLRGAFPRKIMPMDIDASVEINGNFLWFETKKPGAPIPQGQMMALNAHSQNGHTVFIIHGKTPETFEHLVILHAGRNGYDGKADAEFIKERAAAWAQWAEIHPYTPPGSLKMKLDRVMAMIERLLEDLRKK